MRLNTSSLNDREGFEEFSKLLGLNSRRTTKESTQPRGSARHLAMVYPVKQEFVGIYDPEVALGNGTMFEELNKPFYRGSCRGSNNGEGC